MPNNDYISTVYTALKNNSNGKLTITEDVFREKMYDESYAKNVHTALTNSSNGKFTMPENVFLSKVKKKDGTMADTTLAMETGESEQPKFNTTPDLYKWNETNTPISLEMGTSTGYGAGNSVSGELVKESPQPTPRQTLQFWDKVGETTFKNTYTIPKGEGKPVEIPKQFPQIKGAEGYERDINLYLDANPKLADKVRQDAATDIEKYDIVQAALKPKIDGTIKGINTLKEMGVESILDSLSKDELALKEKERKIKDMESALKEQQKKGATQNYKEDYQAYKTAVEEYNNDIADFQKYSEYQPWIDEYFGYIKEYGNLQQKLTDAKAEYPSIAEFEAKQKKFNEEYTALSDIPSRAINSITNITRDFVSFPAKIASDIGEIDPNQAKKYKLSDRFVDFMEQTVAPTPFVTKTTPESKFINPETGKINWGVSPILGSVADNIGFMALLATTGRITTPILSSEMAAGAPNLVSAANSTNKAINYTTVIPAYMAAYKQNSEEADRIGLEGASKFSYANVISSIEGFSELIMPDQKLLTKEIKERTLKDFATEYAKGNAIKRISADILENSSKEIIEEYVSAFGKTAYTSFQNIVDGKTEVYIPTMEEMVETTIVSGILGGGITGIGNIGENKSFRNMALFKMAQNYDGAKNILETIAPDKAQSILTEVKKYQAQVGKIPDGISDAKKGAIAERLNKIDDLNKQNTLGLAPAINEANNKQIKKLNEEIANILNNEKFDEQVSADIQADIEGKKDIATPIAMTNDMKEAAADDEIKQTLLEEGEQAANNKLSEKHGLNPEESKQVIQLLKPERNATQERKIAESDKPQYQEGNGGREATEAGDSNRPEQSGQVQEEEIAPIRQLGTGANVYFETEKYRVNDSKDGVMLNIQEEGNLIPILNPVFESVNEAVYVANKFQDIYPNGVPEALKTEQVVEQFKTEYQNEKAQKTQEAEVLIEEYARAQEQESAMESAVKTGDIGTPAENAIARNPFRVNAESYNRFGDPNKVGQNMARTYFTKKGQGNPSNNIDAIAQEISNIEGVEVTPDDIVEFMESYQSGIGTPNSTSQNTFYGKNRKPSRAKEIAEQYKELTGQELTDEVVLDRLAPVQEAEALSEIVPDEFYDNPTIEELNEYDQKFNEGRKAEDTTTTVGEVEAETNAIQEPAKANTVSFGLNVNFDLGDAPKKVKRFFREYFTPKGLFTSEIFARKIKMESKLNARIQQVKYTARDFRSILKKTKYEDIPNIDKVLKGEAPITSLPEDLQLITAQMRNEVDALSREMIRTGVVEGEMAAVFDKNLGLYLTRSYKAFDDPASWKNFIEKTPQGQLIRNRAVAFIKSRDAERGGSLTQEEIDGQINELLFSSDAPLTLLKNGKVGSKDMSILNQRKEIAPEIRALLGEYDDPLLNYSRSVVKMANLLEKSFFLSDIKKMGMNKFLFEKPKGDYYVQIAAKGSQTMSPLNGLYTTEELAKAFENFDDINDYSWYARAYLTINGLVKYTKTVGSIQTHMRNFVGNVGFAIMNGHWRANKGSVGVKTVLNDLGALNSKEWRERYKKYLELGVVYDNANAGELRQILQDIKDKDYGFEKIVDSRIKKVKDKIIKGTTALYMAEDDMWKIYAFENEKERYAKAYPDKPIEEIEEIAARIVRDTYPTYSLVPKAIKQIRNFPLYGTFVSFPAEVIRTSARTVIQAKTELANPETRSIGIQRTAGILTAMTLTGGLSLASKALVNLTWDDEDDKRKFMAPWTKNSQLVWLGPDTYIDLGYSDPHNYLKVPFRALMFNDNPVDGATEALREFFSPFLSEEILASKLIDIQRNKQESGAPVYNEELGWPDKLAQMYEHVAEALEPGTARSFRRIWLGIQGETINGRKYDPVDEAIATFSGQRIETVDIKNSMGFRVYEYSKKLAEAKRIYYSEKEGNAKELKEALRKANEALEKNIMEMHEYYTAAVRQGVNPKDIAQMFKNTRFPLEERDMVITGVYKPWEPEKQR